MKVLALHATDFRNLENVLVEPHPRFNVFSGDNGQGKTNLLEAIYLLGTLRSFRAGKTEEMIRFGVPRARVKARVRRLESERVLEVELTPGHKSARIDGKAARASAYFGGFNVVLFAPEDLRLPRGAPSQRRKFMDRAVWNARSAYLEEAQTYERVLRSRNALLRDGNAREDLLEVYDTQLCQAAVPLVTRRRELAGQLVPRAQRAFEWVTGGLHLEARYLSSLDVDAAQIPSLLGDKLRTDRARDRARGATSSGPHTDDLALAIDGHEAGSYASQGQLRAIVLSLKIAEIELLTELLGDAPVLLLDDVSSELDPTRNAQLFEFLKSVNGQAFITTTHPAHVLLDQERKDFQVFGGAIPG